MLFNFIVYFIFKCYSSSPFIRSQINRNNTNNSVWRNSPQASQVCRCWCSFCHQPTKDGPVLRKRNAKIFPAQERMAIRNRLDQEGTKEYFAFNKASHNENKLQLYAKASRSYRHRIRACRPDPRLLLAILSALLSFLHPLLLFGFFFVNRPERQIFPLSIAIPK